MRGNAMGEALGGISQESAFEGCDICDKDR